MDDCIEGFKLAAGKISPIFLSQDDTRSYNLPKNDVFGRLTGLEKIKVCDTDDSASYYVKCWTWKSGQFRPQSFKFEDDAPVISWGENGFRRIIKHRLGISRTLEPWTITVVILRYTDDTFTTPAFPCQSLRAQVKDLSK